MVKEKDCEYIDYYCFSCGEYRWRKGGQKKCFICGNINVYAIKNEKDLMEYKNKKLGISEKESNSIEKNIKKVEEIFMEEFNKLISKKMKESLLDKKKLANLLGVTTNFVTKLLDGNTDITLKQVVDICEKLNIKFDYNFKEKK